MSSTTTDTIRTATLTGPNTVELHDGTLPPLQAGQVLLHTRYSGISAGTEMNVYRGRAAQFRTRRNPDNGLFEPSDDPEWTYPFAYGYAAVSRVAATADDVTDVRPGDLVFSYTPHTTATIVDAADVIVLPNLPDERIGVLNANLNTAYNGILDAHPNIGDTVVVSGLGVIGLIQVQLLARAGHRVIGIDTVAQRRDLATRFGAAVVLEPGPTVASTVRDLTENRGADIVIEVSGAAIALHEAIRIVGYCGTVIAMSWYGGTFEALNLTGEFHHNRPRIISSQVGGLPPAIGPLWNMQRRQENVSRFMQELDLEPLLTHVLPIDAAAEAYRVVDSRPDDLVQMILDYTGQDDA